MFPGQLTSSDPEPANPGSPAQGPVVSVVAIFLNGVRWLGEAIDSVLSQTMQDFELILVDDGSSDGSTELALEYQRRFPGRVRYIDHPGHENRGMSASRNAGAAVARGEFIALIDADDVWLEGKLAGQLDAFTRFPDAAMVADGAIYWNSWQGGQDDPVLAGHVQDRIVAPSEASLRVYPLGKAQAPCPSAIMVRADAWRAVGGFEPAFHRPHDMYEDQAFLSKVYLRFPVVFRGACSIRYRQHDDSCMSSVGNAGRYHEIRAYFVSWFRRWLDEHGAGGRRLHLRLAMASWRYRHPRVSSWAIAAASPVRRMARAGENR